MYFDLFLLVVAVAIAVSVAIAIVTVAVAPVRSHHTVLGDATVVENSFSFVIFSDKEFGGQ